MQKSFISELKAIDKFELGEGRQCLKNEKNIFVQYLQYHNSNL